MGPIAPIMAIQWLTLPMDLGVHYFQTKPCQLSTVQSPQRRPNKYWLANNCDNPRMYMLVSIGQ